MESTSPAGRSRCLVQVPGRTHPEAAYACWWARRRGAFILTSDERRTSRDVTDPHLPSWEIHPLNGSPADPNRLHASQTSGWFGQVIQRSLDGGKTWEPVGIPFAWDETFRDHGPLRRRPIIHFLACEPVWPHGSGDAPLPGAVAGGIRPFRCSAPWLADDGLGHPPQS